MGMNTTFLHEILQQGYCRVKIVKYFFTFIKQCSFYVYVFINKLKMGGFYLKQQNLLLPIRWGPDRRSPPWDIKTKWNHWKVILLHVHVYQFLCFNCSVTYINHFSNDTIWDLSKNYYITCHTSVYLGIHSLPFLFIKVFRSNVPYYYCAG